MNLSNVSNVFYVAGIRMNARTARMALELNLMVRIF